jgi:hypothetical protein
VTPLLVRRTAARRGRQTATRLTLAAAGLGSSSRRRRRARCRHGQRRLHDMAGQRAHVFPLLSSTHRLERARARSESSSWIAPTDDDTAGGDEPLAGAAPCAAVPALSQRLGCRRTLPPRRAIPSRMGGWELAVRGSPGLFRPD